MSFIIPLLAISVVIFVHECGHLLFAKCGRIGVIEFSLGMGPKIAGFLYKDTRYSLRVFPLGGYVKLAGLDDRDSGLDPSTYFQNRPLIHRFLTILGGSLMNIILGYCVFFFITLFVGQSQVTSVIESVEQGSPAFSVGIQGGDQLQALNGQEIIDIKRDFIAEISKSESVFTLDVLREGELKSLQIQPVFDEKRQVYRVGVLLGVETVKSTVFSAVFDAASMTVRAVTLVFVNLSLLFDGDVSMKDLSGPVGIVQIASHQLAQSIAHFLNLMAFISIMLGIINLFPIPVLDGGHLMFLSFESVFKRPVPEKFQLMVNNVFAVFLVGLMVYVIFNDVRFWSERTDLLRSLE